MSCPSLRSWLAAGLALALSALVLGPVLGRGIALSYDLAWSPDARLTPFGLGVGTPAPRAVPSDVAAVALGWVLTPAVAQKVVLLGILVLAGLGARALVLMWRPRAVLLAQVAAVVVGIWNPFVAERLVIGQWTVLVGYAALPWAVRAAIRCRGSDGSTIALVGWVVLAGAGGANACLVVLPVVVLLLLVPSPRWRPAAVVVLSGAGVCAAWALPALAAHGPSNSAGFTAFAARPDTPLGLVGSLAGGGALWNPAAYPPERGVAVLAAAMAVLLSAGWFAVVSQGGAPSARTVAWLGLAGALLAAASGAAWLSGLWTSLSHLPGGDLLRDAQKLVALWVVVGAAGSGILVDRLMARAGVAVFPAVALTVAAPLLLPSLAWGASGRLAAVEVPADLRAAATRLSTAAPGDVGLLPWRQYRRYAWNDGRVSLSLVPRMVAHPVVFDDSLPLSSGRIAGEDPRAQRLGQALASADPWSALAAAGLRYVVVERQAGLDEGPTPSSSARVLSDTPHVLVVELAGASPMPTEASAALRWGWAVTLTTGVGWGVVAATRAARRMSRRRSDRLVASTP